MANGHSGGVNVTWDAVRTIFPNRLPPYKSNDAEKLAVFVLKCDLNPGIIKEVYKNSSVKIFADGGSNCVYDSLEEDERSKYLPDCIVGDMDSIRPDVLEYYKSKSVEIFRSDCKYTTDFEKCMVYLRRLEELGKNHYPSTAYLENCYEFLQTMSSCTELGECNTSCSHHRIVVLCSTSGRLDQTIGIINSLLMAEPSRRMYLVIGANIALLLRRGNHTIRYLYPIEGPYCGLVPLSHELLNVQTHGLVWDIDYSSKMGFGKLISTNNVLRLGQDTCKDKQLKGTSLQCATDEVKVATSGNLMWTVSFDYSKLDML